VTLRPSLARPPFDGALYAENRARLAAALRAAGAPRGAVVLLRGGAAETRHETDHELLFRQESFFHWAFGVREPDCLGAVAVDSGAATLFIPRLDAAYAVVMGAIRPPAAWAATYGLESVRFEDEAPAALRALVGAAGGEAAGGRRGAPLLRLRGYNTDGKKWAAPARFDGDEAFVTDDAALWPVITELRALKTPREAALLRYVAALTSEAHIAVMQAARAGLTEFQMESVFKHWCYYYGGARHASYTCICASGANGAVLHYGHAGEPNARTIAPGDMLLFDMGRCAAEARARARV
jgi:Xaa-Pro dipeptidase